MDNNSFRSLTDVEKAIINRLLEQEFPGKNEILRQLIDCTVRSIDENGSLQFRIASSLKASTVVSRVPTEGEVEDCDSIMIHFLLHVVDGVLTDLEIYKEDSSRIVAMPPSDAIQVYAAG